MARSVPALIKPALLVWARNRSGLDLEQTALKLKLDPAVLRAWEDGLERPSISQLRELGEIYRRPLAVFFLSEPPKEFETQRLRRRVARRATRPVRLPGGGNPLLSATEPGEKLNPEWIVLMEVVRELGQQPYANPVGRVIFQKIAYVLTEMGVQTGFRFGKGSYGPFAGEVMAALHELANRNWVREEQLGKMTALRSAPQYELDRTKFSEVIARNSNRIAKTVDLFSRIKNTDQAEEVLTVLFASRELKKQIAPGTEVDEQQLYDYILDWKKLWRTEEKKNAVADAIRNLVILGWMRLRFSDSLPEVM